MNYQQTVDNIAEATRKVDKASGVVRASILNPRLMPPTKKDMLDYWIPILKEEVRKLEMAADIYITCA